MAVYFVYRCHYGAPSEKHVRRFEYDTVLDWAQAVFRQLPGDDAYSYAEELLGGLHVYSFGSMFRTDDEHPPRVCPQTMKDVGVWFSNMYDQGQANGPHHVQLLTDDDEIELAVYVFDDHYRAANPGKADFLLVAGWELPGGEANGPPPDLPQTSVIEPRGESEGTVYAVSLFAEDSSNLSDLCPASRIEGLRLPDLVRYLLLHPDEDALDGGLYETREALRRGLEAPTGEDAGFLIAIRDQPAELTHWGAYSDWLQDRDLPPAGLLLLDRAVRVNGYSGARQNPKPELDCVKVTAHLAQVCKHEGNGPNVPFGQIIFFDDRWAAAHPTLAAGILTFASRWDVLT